ncbi:MAG: phosphatase domain-containing protein [Alphaproteobacteria bacterium]
MAEGGGLRRLLRVLGRPVRRFGQAGPYALRPYRGYASDSEAFLMGRVFRQLAGATAIEGPEPAGNLRALGRRLLRWGARGAMVRATLDGHALTAETDRDGYFRLHWRGLALRPDASPWHRVAVELLGRDGAPTVTAEGAVYLAPPSSDFVVISDIDDTVMHTGVANAAVMMWQLFFKPAESRLTFPGVGAFYRALHEGGAGAAGNPMLFVSRAPWSIYDVLEAFFTLHGIPGGPVMFLREWGLTLQSPLPRRARDHKRSLVAHIMDLYAGRPAVLIGDSGQHDPELYAEIVRRYPGRVRAIYIRDVGAGADRAAAIRALGGGPVETAVPFLLSDSTVAMAENAAALGLIRPEALQAVAADAAPDPAADSPVG